MGHALHMEPGPFQDIVTCDRTKKLLKALGYDQVSIPQRIRSFIFIFLGRPVASTLNLTQYFQTVECKLRHHDFINYEW